MKSWNRKPKSNPGRRSPAAVESWATRTVLSRTLIVMAIGISLFLPLLVTLFRLMVVDHDVYEQMAIQNQTRSTPLTADRGMIYDRNMNILATSASVENVFLDPNELKEKEQDLGLISTGLGEILEVEPGFILEQAADTTKRYKVIKRKIEDEQAQKVRDFINTNKLQGVYLEPDTRRSYPYGTLCAQVLGFTRADNVGAEGLEAYYDASLTGTGGKVVVTKGNYGSEMLYTYEKYYDADNGDSLILTLDTSVQYYLEKNLETAIRKYDVINGAFGIVADVNTGEILGMATLGSYDPNHYADIYDEEVAQALEAQYQAALGFHEGSEAYKLAIEEYNQAVSAARLRQWRNRAVSDGYEPGSTFKLITLASALEEQAVTLNDSFYCDGEHDFPGRDQTVHCWKKGGHGQQNTGKALENSCNIAFSAIGVKLGGLRMRQYMKDFGLLEKTGIDLSGEASGSFYSEAEMDPTAPGAISNAISTSFGQTFKITPIQLVRAVSAIVNGGYLLEPYIVSEVVDSDGNVVQKNERTVIRQVISEETSATMRELMEAVVATGTAGNARVVGYRVGGKTGTAEKTDVFDENGKMTEDKIVSFIGVAPIDDPKYVVLVALDTPSTETGIYISGGIMAAPTVRDVFTDILPYLGVEPDYTDADISKINVSVPNVLRMSKDEAEAALWEKSLTCRTVGEGPTVTDMIPAPNSDVPGASEVILYMGAERPTDLISVPDFIGMSVAQANQAAVDSGLYLQSKGSDQNSAAVSVTYQDIEPGTPVDRGTTVTVEFTDHSAGD